MGILERLFSWNGAEGVGGAVPAALPKAALDSADLAKVIGDSVGGVSARDALRNSSVHRCVSLISSALGQLPTALVMLDDDGIAIGKARDHAVHRLLARRPNNWQTPFVFKRHMQRQALVKGNAYALPIKTGTRISELIPLNPDKMRVEQASDWTCDYIYAADKGREERRWKSGQILHLMGPSEDGIKGMSMTDYARDVLNLSRQSDRTMMSMMKRGARPGGMLGLPAGRTLTAEQHARLSTDFAENYGGADNEGKWIIGEDGLAATQFIANGRDMQAVEFRNQQTEEIARIFGVPRPFLMLDDTSWGSGIEQLGLFFVQYGLGPWFVAWEQAIAMALLNEREMESYSVKFNERALLRGLMKDQGEYLAKLLGSGGAPQVIEQNEARALLDMPPHVDGYGLSSGMGAPTNEPQ